jgi:glycosyltransferase involved in cell wall biosynthesis
MTITAKRQNELAVVVPVYRNAATLRVLAERTTAALFEYCHDYQIVFVIDDSPDNSWNIVQSMANDDSRVAGILLARNVGQHEALLIGMRHVDADWYAIMDADLQDPPELLADLFRLARSERQTLFGCREGIYQSIGRMLTSRIYKTLIRCLTGLPPNAGTFLVMPKTVAGSLLAMKMRFPHVVMMAHHAASSRAAFRYRRAERSIGTSAYTCMRRFKAGWQGLYCALDCCLGFEEDTNHSFRPIAGKVNL